jgi:hypothetical protein
MREVSHRRDITTYCGILSFVVALAGFLMILAVLCVVFVLLLAWAPHIWWH